jgi:hypothetical protein
MSITTATKINTACITRYNIFDLPHSRISDLNGLLLSQPLGHSFGAVFIQDVFGVRSLVRGNRTRYSALDGFRSQDTRRLLNMLVRRIVS